MESFVIGGSKSLRMSWEGGKLLKDGRIVGLGVHIVPFINGCEINGDDRDAFAEATDGSPCNGSSSYDALGKIWGWIDSNVTRKVDDFQEVESCNKKRGQIVEDIIREFCGKNGSHGADTSCAFLLKDGKTEKIFGAIRFEGDRADHLRVELGDIVVHPSYMNSLQLIEGIGLLLDRLFSVGYRRVESCFDELDFERSRLLRFGLGMKMEGTRMKSRIRWGSNVDEGVCALVNTDWSGGKREDIWRRIYGTLLSFCEAQTLVARPLSAHHHPNLIN